MVQCSVKGCSSRSDVHSTLKHNVHFHRVPKNPELRYKWMQAINKAAVGDSTRVCSNHFKSENYYTTPNGVKKLVISAIPDKDLGNDVKEVSSVDDENSQHTFIKTIFPSPRILKVTHLQQLNSNESQCSQRPDPNNIIRIPQIRLDPNEVRKKIEKTAKVTTVNVLETTIESTVEENYPEQRTLMETDPLELNTKNKTRTPLERKLIMEVKKLRELNKKRLEALNCLEEQNRRLLKRNNFLQEELDKKCKEVPEVSNTASKDFNFFSK